MFNASDIDLAVTVRIIPGCNYLFLCGTSNLFPFRTDRAFNDTSKKIRLWIA